jgi:hypothetical protein
MIMHRRQLQAATFHKGPLEVGRALESGLGFGLGLR